MNKLLGFYELKNSVLPTIPWNQFKGKEKLDSSLLWTIRSAVYRGDDLNLPRAVGIQADEAIKFANSLLSKLKDNGMVIYYPYFVAEKSGTLNVFSDRIIIEAVKNDLWNLVTYSDRDVTIIYDNKSKNIIGNESFINNKEFEELNSYVKYINRTFRDDLLEGKSVLLEWSYAYNCDCNKNKIGDRYLVFYEVRTL